MKTLTIQNVVGQDGKPNVLGTFGTTEPIPYVNSVVISRKATDETVWIEIFAILNCPFGYQPAGTFLDSGVDVRGLPFPLQVNKNYVYSYDVTVSNGEQAPAVDANIIIADPSTLNVSHGKQRKK